MDDFIRIRDFVLHHDLVVVTPINDDTYEISWPQGKIPFSGTIPDKVIIKIYQDLAVGAENE